MSTMERRGTWIAVTLAGAMAVLAGCTQMQQMMGTDKGGRTQNVSLSGNNEVPPVTTSASGSGTVTVFPDRHVNVRITVTGMSATAAHIHEGGPSVSGPVIVPLNKSGDNTFVTAEGARFTESQYDAYKKGNTYLNVHSAKNPPGEVRAQLRGN